MAKKHIVSFMAHEKVKEPVKVSFESKKGHVSFPAHKKVTGEVRVTFKAKDK